MHYSLRTATHEDYDFLQSLHRLTMKEYVRATWGWDDEDQAQRFKDEFKPENEQIIVVDGKDVGVLSYEQRPEELFIRTLLVHPGHQGKGIGSQVLGDIIAEGRAKNLPVALQVLKANPSAKRLYDKVGFTTSGETETHFQMRVE